MPALNRRQLLGGLCAACTWPALIGCANPLPLAADAPLQDDGQAARWLSESAEQHGWSRFQALNDINVAYQGQWRPLIDRIQPVIVDKAWRERSEERLLPRERFIAQAHQGAAGRKQVVRTSGHGRGGLGQVAVWYQGQPDTGEPVLTAAALVADCYQLFLLGPLWLAQRAGPTGQARLALGGQAEVEGHACQWVQAWVSPGLGQVARDRVDLAIDMRGRTTRRMRFTLDGFAGTRGAVAEVDTYEHRRIGGILWPMRSFERVVHPLGGLPAHDWRITGLDLDRGYAAADVQGPHFTGAALAPAQVVTGALRA
jgi:hypothetical protein